MGGLARGRGGGLAGVARGLAMGGLGRRLFLLVGLRGLRLGAMRRAAVGLVGLVGRPRGLRLARGLGEARRGLIRR